MVKCSQRRRKPLLTVVSCFLCLRASLVASRGAQGGQRWTCTMQTHFPLSHERHPEADTRLRGRGLVLAWILWVTIALLALLVYMFSLPTYYTQLHTVCTTGVCVPGQLSPARAQALYRMSFSLSLYAATGIGLNIATALVWFIIAAVLLWRQSTDRMALLVALALVLVGATVPPDQSAPAWQWPLSCSFLSSPSFPMGDSFLAGCAGYRSSIRC